MGLLSNIAAYSQKDDFYNTGVEKFKQKDFQGALQSFSKAIELDPVFTNAFFERAKTYKKLLQLEQAIKDYSKVITLINSAYDKKMQKEHPNSYSGGGAQINFTAVAETDPLYINAYNNRAVVYIELKKWREANDDIFIVLTIDKNNLHGLLEQGWVLQKQNYWNDAIKVYTQVLSLDSTHLDAYYQRGSCYTQLERMKDEANKNAINDLTKVISAQPTNSNAFWYRGIAYGNLKQWDNQITDFTTVLKLEPTFSSALTGRGKAYENLQQYDKAIPDYSKAIELDPKNVEAINSRASAFSQLKQWDNAILDFNKQIEIDPSGESVKAYFDRGMAYKNLKQWDNACKDFKKVHEFGSDIADEMIERFCH